MYSNEASIMPAYGLGLIPPEPALRPAAFYMLNEYLGTSPKNAQNVAALKVTVQHFL